MLTDLQKDEFYKANSDLVIGVQWLSALDSNTSTICRSLDGRIFKVNEIRPPLHPNCRSVMIPITRLSALFNKGATRASEFGQVPAELTYYEWLNLQSEAYQYKVLGEIKCRLFREGGLSAKRFAELQLDRNFSPITLERMKELEPLAFERAGL